MRPWWRYVNFFSIPFLEVFPVNVRFAWFQVGAQSTATAMILADLYPSLRFIVQMSEPGANGQGPPPSHVAPQAMYNRYLSTPTSTSGASTPMSKSSEMPVQLSSRITVQQRAPGTLQSFYGAAIYILRLPSPSPAAPSHSLPPRIIAELRAHIGVLRASNGATLVLTARLLPEPGTVDPDVEATARLRDLTLLQLANEREVEMSQLIDMLNSVRDSMGRLVLVNKLRSRSNATVAFEVRYQPYSNRHEVRPSSTNV